MKKILTIFILAITFSAFAQSPSIGIPDSVQNVSKPGSTGQYIISNPLVHNGTQFTNAPVDVLTPPNSKSDYLYFYDLDLNVPAGATITGVEVIHGRGGCNTGSYVIDSLHLAYNGAIISNTKRDSTSYGTDTLGSPTDNWGATLTPALVNDNSFGLYINSTGTGICTFQQGNIQVKICYCLNSSNGINSIINEVNVSVFPNPVNDNLTLVFGIENIKNTYKIYDFTGKIVAIGSLNGKTSQIKTVGFNKGLYFIVIDGLNVSPIKFIRN
jgi:hypothetical protein